MRILLTGADGQIGSALRPRLEKMGAVMAPTIDELDLSGAEALAERLDRMSPSLIVNPAAYTAVDRAESDRTVAFRINADAPRVMADWAARRRIPLVHFSTDYVFDGTGHMPRREDAPTAPLSVYGASKLAGDLAVQAANGAHLIVRTSWVYAARGTNFLRTIARLASERNEIRVVADQIGAPTSSRSVADAVLAMLGPDVADLPAAFAARSGIVNVVCAGETSWHGFAVAILNGLKSRGMTFRAVNIVPITTKEFLTAAVRPANSRLDLGRLRSVFGVEMPDWQDALATELDEYVAIERGGSAQ
jgi:dTDP-4-dehydrorhamnose reductase